MQDESNHSSHGGPAGQASVDAVARRRLLLKSLGKGSAIAVAATPMASFAAPLLVPTTDGTQCTISGFKSALASRSPVGSLPCGGYSPSHFVASSNPNGWPSFTFPLPSGTASLADLKFSDLFGASAPTALVLDILNTAPTGGQALFVAAYFNALLNAQGASAPPGRVVMPYSTSDVVSQYANGAYTPDTVQFYQLILVVS